MTDHELHSAWIDTSGRTGGETGDRPVFPWWSLTKTAIATCVMQRAEAGKADLDAALPDAPYSLRQLLQHRAGLPDYGGLAAYHLAVRRGDLPWQRWQLLAAAGAETQAWPPGTRFAYSNIGYLYLREWLEEQESAPLAEILARRIAAPLGLASTRLAETPEAFAAVHWPALEGYDPGWVYHGCLIGPALEAARFVHGLATGALVAPETLEEMRRPLPVGGPMGARPWRTPGYGLGLMAGGMSGAGRVFGHSGGGPFSTNAVYHLMDATPPLTIACFAGEEDESSAEAGVVRVGRAIGALA
ncbi:serine hydrolase domain-containing protein [Rhodobacteraceae bacterium DSL-40]|uniref:serine hydrolase domain-containing protein n=1 Tax=Amaricoccus sp. B4 TaxID=3368557 RepID=UPI000DAE8590